MPGETIVINPVSSHTEAYVPTVRQSSAQTTPPNVQKPTEDSVHLSPQAQAAASGDVDHDGDSH